MTADELNARTKRIVDGYYRVYNALGWGFLEAVYRRALANALRKAGASVEPESRHVVYFDGDPVGEYRADLLVDGAIVVEVKAVARLAPEHKAQVINYLRASHLEVGLLLNFGPAPEVRRVLFTNDRKRIPPPFP